MGRPVFCISLRRNGPFDFVTHVRIMAGLSAVADQQRLVPKDYDRGSCSSSVSFASTDTDHGEESRFPFMPVTRMNYDDEPHARTSKPEETWPGRAPSDGDSGVHERWQSLSDDAEGLRAVVHALKLRLSGYPTGSLGLADDGGEVVIGDGSGGDAEESEGRVASDHSHGKVPSCTTEVKEAIRVSDPKRYSSLPRTRDFSNVLPGCVWGGTDREPYTYQGQCSVKNGQFTGWNHMVTTHGLRQVETTVQCLARIVTVYYAKNNRRTDRRSLLSQINGDDRTLLQRCAQSSARIPPVYS